jgi:hypothetical protein
MSQTTKSEPGAVGTGFCAHKDHLAATRGSDNGNGSTSL